MKFNLAKSDFGQNFIFGAATAAYQIEGGQGPETGRGRCHWDTFAATRGNVVGLETGAQACDHYNRWAEDVELNATPRFSVTPLISPSTARCA